MVVDATLGHDVPNGAVLARSTAPDWHSSELEVLVPRIIPQGGGNAA